jgi:hypothetical protein
MSEAGLRSRSSQSKLVVKTTSTQKLFLFLLGVLCLLGMALVGLFTSSGLDCWLSILLLLALLTAVISLASTGHWLGLLIDERNEMSLSRFQMALWTLLILSAFLGMTMVNIFHHQNPVEAMSSIVIPPTLLVLMGMSATSLVSAPLILTLKQKANQAIDTKLGSGEKASFIDLFLGDDKANGKRLDLGKLQMFYFTVILALAYAVSLGSVFTDEGFGGTHPLQFPALNEQFLVLLGISHAGYLLYKAVPRDGTGASSRSGPARGSGTAELPQNSVAQGIEAKTGEQA